MARAATDVSPEPPPGGSPPRPGRNALALAALGVVFGDIGTSPLYAFQSAIAGVPVEEIRGSALGMLSLFFWALTLVVTLKYLMFVMRADHRGEGGVFALLALVRATLPESRNLTPVCVLLLFGAGLMLGDGVITPAISVLSAVEGVTVVAPHWAPWVVPVSCAILAVLFWAQRFGTQALGAAFGPVMLMWFLALGVLGVWHIVAGGGTVLAALNPWHALSFLANNSAHAVPVLGAVVLCVTGAEALYADLGHFGRPAIARAWLWVAWPALALNYFGQGALVLAHPADADNPFFRLVPEGAATYALVALATAATIIASQSVITGVFSLARQAMQLNYFPTLKVVHTDERMEGHIYVPFVNFLIGALCVLTVLWFRTPERLTDAYGLAITGTMLVTSVAYAVVRRRHLRRPWWDVLGLLALFLAVDTPFFLANLPKFAAGGWYPVALASVALVVMVTWRAGRNALRRHVARDREPLDKFLRELDSLPLYRHRGTTVYVTPYTNFVPRVLADSARRNLCLPGHVILMVTRPLAVPRADPVDEAPRLEPLSHGFFNIELPYGYHEQPDLLACVSDFAPQLSPDFHPDTVMFLSSIPRIVPSPHPRPPGSWRAPEIIQRLFRFLVHNARTEMEFFRAPADRTFEVLRRFEI